MSRTIKHLNVISYNVNSLISHPKRISLQHFLNRNNPDAVLLSETRLVSNNRLHFERYKMYRMDNNALGRGTAILVRSAFKCTPVTLQGLKTFELTCILITSANNSPLLLVSLYNKCNATSSDIKHDLDRLHTFCLKYPLFIIGGDFNARHPLWMDSLISSPGRAIADWLLSNSHQHSFEVISQPLPTFPRTPSLIDFFICSPTLVCSIPQLTNYRCETIASDSDHFAVKLNVQLKISLNFLLVQKEEFTNFKKINWNIFQESLTDKLRNNTPSSTVNLSNVEIDSAIAKIESSISETIAEQPCSNPAHSRYKDLPMHIQNMYKYRQKLRKILQRIFHRTLNTYNSEYQSIQSQLNCLNTLIKENTKSYINSQFKRRLNNIRPGPDTFKKINQIVGKKSPIVNQLEYNSTYISSNEEKSDAFAENFANNFQPNPPTHLPEFLNNVNAEVAKLASENIPSLTRFSENNSSVCSLFNDQFTSPTDLRSAIQSGNAKKSSGHDKISNFVIKRLPATAIIFITIILNNCLNNSYFPTKWKIAEIFPIPKKSGANSISNYRPISLLPNLSKLLEMLILNQIRSLCTTLDIVQHNQFGFKAAHSTFHPLLMLHADVTLGLNKKEATAVCLLDIEKAFDSVWIEGLVFKLKSLNFPKHIIRMVLSFLTNRKFYVRVGTSKSSLRDIRAGVAQGSRLGPILFNLYTYDQPPNVQNTKTLLYADDSATYSSSTSPAIALRRVSEHIFRLWDYYLKWGIKINSAKTELICLRNPATEVRSGIATKVKNLSLALPDNSIIRPKDHVKYLGINFTERFKFNKHASLTLKKANHALSLVLPLMRVRGGLDTRTKVLLYKQLVRPILTYCFPIWYTISPSYMKKIQIFERKALRHCTSLFRNPRTLHYYRTELLYDTAKITPIDKYLCALSLKMLRKIPSHDNPLINLITGNTYTIDRYLDVLSIMDPEFSILQEEEESFDNFYLVAGTQYNRG